MMKVSHEEPPLRAGWIVLRILSCSECRDVLDDVKSRRRSGESGPKRTWDQALNRTGGIKRYDRLGLGKAGTESCLIGRIAIGGIDQRSDHRDGSVVRMDMRVPRMSVNPYS